MEDEFKRGRLIKYRRMKDNPNLKVDCRAMAYGLSRDGQGISDHGVKRLVKKAINDGHTSATHAVRTELVHHQEQPGYDQRAWYIGCYGDCVVG